MIHALTGLLSVNRSVRWQNILILFFLIWVRFGFLSIFSVLLRSFIMFPLLIHHLFKLFLNEFLHLLG